MAEATVDGRVLRGQRSREKIVAAVVDIYRAGELNPTAACIAKEAGLSERSVYSHFDDMETLTSEVATAQEPQFQELIQAPIPEGGLATRIDELVHHRAIFWERVTPVSRAARVHAATNDGVRRALDRALGLLRQQVDAVFADVLDGVADADDRDTLVEALDTTFGWETWDRLRTARRLDVDQSKAVVGRMCRALLSV